MVGQHLHDLTLDEPLLYAAPERRGENLCVQPQQCGALGVVEAQELNE